MSYEWRKTTVGYGLFEVSESGKLLYQMIQIDRETKEIRMIYESRWAPKKVLQKHLKLAEFYILTENIEFLKQDIDEE